MPGHRPGVPGTPGRPGGFQKIYVIFPSVPFLLPRVNGFLGNAYVFERSCANFLPGTSCEHLRLPQTESLRRLFLGMQPEGLPRSDQIWVLSGSRCRLKIGFSRDRVEGAVLLKRLFCRLLAFLNLDGPICANRFANSRESPDSRESFQGSQTEPLFFANRASGG